MGPRYSAAVCRPSDAITSCQKPRAQSLSAPRNDTGQGVVVVKGDVTDARGGGR